MSDACCLTLNPDITGIGVRVGLYAQIMLTWLVAIWYPKKMIEGSRAGYMTATALLIAAFIQLSTKQMSLLDGLVVSLVTTLIIPFSIAAYPSKRTILIREPNIDQAKLKSVTRWIIQFCFVIFWGAWCFYLWRDPASFGLQGQPIGCNDNFTLSIFGREVHPTDPHVRSTALVLISCAFFVALSSLFLSLEDVMRGIQAAIDKCRNVSQERAAGEKGSIHQILEALAASLIQIIAIAVETYLIIITEQTIRRNDITGSTNAWTYGQTIPLILLLQQVMEACSTCVEENEEEKKQDEEKREQEKGEQEKREREKVGQQGNTTTHQEVLPKASNTH